MEIRVVLFGIGAMGGEIAKVIGRRKNLKIVGAIDIAEDKVGKDLGGLLGVGKGVSVTDPKSLPQLDGDIVVHATTSSLKQAHPQIAKCVTAGLNVVSTCEELSYPYRKYPEIAKEMDTQAKIQGVTVLGTGINPGFLMDTLPIVLTAPCQVVSKIRVTRMMDAAKRRVPFQKKIGVGLAKEEFERLMREKIITGHVGLYESIAMIADAVGWELDAIRESIPEPVIAKKEVRAYKVVKAGQVAGLRSVACGIKDGERVILEFISYAGADEYDAISIDGVPNIRVRIEGGVHGDIGTVAMVVNSIPKVVDAKPGLITMRDIPPPSAIGAKD
jgi:4-hydroxy-tetrahydrodipicolinate reductase